jgi:hypothetical protein
MLEYATLTGDRWCQARTTMYRTDPNDAKILEFATGLYGYPTLSGFVVDYRSRRPCCCPEFAGHFDSRLAMVQLSWDCKRQRSSMLFDRIERPVLWHQSVLADVQAWHHHCMTWISLARAYLPKGRPQELADRVRLTAIRAMRAFHRMERIGH